MLAEKNRIRNLSTRWLTPFKIALFVIYSVLFLGIVWSFVDDVHNISDWFSGIMMAGVYGYLFYHLMLVTTKLYRVEFDQEYLYVLLRKQDILIPLENIESIEIATLGGVYKVNLFHKDQLGDHFYFKLSLFYPINAKSKDALVNVLRKYVVQARGKRQEIMPNALHS